MHAHIAEMLRIMMDDFASCSSGLLEISSRDTFDFEKGLYGALVAKPSRRLASVLSIDRELLVLFSTFTDQQARTIKVLRQQLDLSQGRLESTVAVVVHRDRNGNPKLKKWGREQGLSVLPVFADSPLPRGDGFEHLLCHELYSHDPFDVTGPVSSDDQFYGRRTEALDLARKLQTGQIRSCMGIRKIGKTSILNRIVHETKENHTCLCIMIDCSRDDVWAMDAPQMLSAIAQALQVSIGGAASYLTLEPCSASPSMPQSAEAVKQALQCAQSPVIVFFDEVDYITPGSPTAPHWRGEFNRFWRNLRAVYQEAGRSAVSLSIMISGVSSKWFTVESIDGIENAALSLIPEEYLSPLPRGATIAMIRKLGRTAGLLFEETVASQIAEVCADMPYWVRKTCSYIHRYIDVGERPLTPSADRVRGLVEDFVRYEGSTIAQVALRHLFRVFPELEQVVSDCAESAAEGCSQYYLGILEKYGVISKKDAYELSGDMIAHGFRLYLDSKAGRENGQPEEGETGSTGGTELDEWADEIAVISKRRNLLEKRLRSIALNFIRYDVLSKSGATTVTERLLAVFPSDKRKKLAYYAAEELIEKYNWTDLVQLVSREWTLFEKVFGDKSQFIQNCAVVNDRFDAHAKDADVADFALYRRSLKLLEDPLAKLQ